METEFICGGSKYEIYKTTNTIGLPITLNNLPETIQIKGDTLYFPGPFHVSLFYTGRYIDKYGISIPDFVNKIVRDFCDFTKTNNIEFLGYKNEYRLVSRDDLWKKTVVVMCEISNLNKFFDSVNKKYNLKIKYPVPHVTIYNTKKGEPGMYLLDSDDIENNTILIENPIGFPL